jgi:uncharacterized protein
VIGIADTGFILGIAIVSDRFHAACMRTHAEMSQIFLPQSVLTESVYMLIDLSGKSAAIRFLQQLPSSKYEITALTLPDLIRTAELFAQYQDTRLDFVDISVVAVAECLNLTHVLTTDRRDFSIIRPRHTEYFELLPEKL